jgi:hypothetical protein
MKHIWLMLVDSKAVKVPTIEDVTVVFKHKVVNQFDPDKPKPLYVSSKHRFFGMSGNESSA